MDYKKFIKIIDTVVQAKIKKILESTRFKSIIREQLKNELHNLLLEMNSNEKNSKKSIKNAVMFSEEKKYPKLEKKFSDNEIINSILLDTINSNNNYFSNDNLFEISENNNNNSIINSISRPINNVQVDPTAIQSEAILLAQRELLKRGIDPSKVEILNEESTNDFKDNFINEYIDDKIADNNYVRNDQAMSSNNINLNFLAKDYTKLLSLADEKSKIYRNR